MPELLLLVGIVIAGTIAYAVVRTLQEGAKNALAEQAARANKDQVIAQTFDGRELVTYAAGKGALPANLVIEAAHSLGYDLTNRSARGGVEDLVFTRRK